MMNTFPRLSLLVATTLLFAIVTPASISSTQEKAAGRPSFDVATVKPGSSATYIPGGPVITDDYFAWNGRTLKMLVGYAYFAGREWQMDWQIQGGTPGWVDSQLWDVEGRAKADTLDANQILQHYPGIGNFDFGLISRDVDAGKRKLAQEVRLCLMLQSLFEDRFKLRVERQTRQAPVYNLVIAKGGARIKPEKDPNAGSGTTTRATGGWARPFEIAGRAVPMERLVRALLSYSDRPIIDRTNLEGLYTYKLQWTPEESGPGDSPLARTSLSLGPAFFTALEEQLGLRLEPAKGPVEYLVIKSVQKPDGIK